MLPIFLNLLQELFNGILVIGNYIRLIDEVIKSCIDFEFLRAVALQALGLVDKENKNDDKNEDDEEVDKVFKLKLVFGFIERS